MSNGAWEHVTTDEGILNGFRQCDYFDFDGILDKLHSKLLDTVKNGELPYKGLVIYNLIVGGWSNSK